MGLKATLILDGCGQRDRLQVVAQSLANFTVTFEKAGTYSYLCNVHPWMTGSVIVE